MVAQVSELLAVTAVDIVVKISNSPSYHLELTNFVFGYLNDNMFWVRVRIFRENNTVQ